MRGYFGIGVYQPKTATNIGTLWRSAYQLGAAFIFTIGRRYSQQASDTVAALRHVPLYNYETWEQFLSSRPIACQLVAIEMGGRDLCRVVHPQACIYLLGAEDNGLPPTILTQCQMTLSIPSVRTNSYNVAVAGSIVMYDRFCKQEARQ